MNIFSKTKISALIFMLSILVVPNISRAESSNTNCPPDDLCKMVAVDNVIDVFAPVVHVIDDVRMPTGPDGAVMVFYYGISAKDNVDGDITPICTPPSGSMFTAAKTVVECTATDKAGNTGRASFNVFVDRTEKSADTTAPVVSVINDVTMSTGPNGSVTVFYIGISAKDDVDGDITPVCTPPSGSVFTAPKTVVECTATDKAGNTGKASFNVFVNRADQPLDPNPTPTPTPPAGGGGSSSGGSSSGGSGSGSSSGGRSTSGGVGTAYSGLGFASTTSFLNILPIGVSNCSYLNSYLKINEENDSAEVKKLQTFLKNNDGFDVDINGIFDQKTLEAVKKFQEKYLEDTMRPWGVNTPTGQVFYTTKKKINEIYCKTILTLTAEQIAEIESYKNNLNSIQINANLNNASGTDTLSPDVGLMDENNQTANLGNSSIASKIWSFVKWLFGY